MGLFTWLGQRGAARTLARSAHEAYLKYKKNDPDLTEAEIAKALFMQRCSSKNLNKAEKVRFKKYLESEGEVDSIFKLCLAILYIVDGISKDDVKIYKVARKVIDEELTQLGYSE